jgi:hypothetical protein
VVSRTVTYRVADCLRSEKIKDPLVQCRTDFEHKGKGHPMPGYELSTDQIGVSLLGLPQGIHDDRLRFEIEKEVQQVVDQRPALKEVAGAFTEKLNGLVRS